MRLFVTGGAGFIGSAFVRHVLATSDDQITVFDALTYAGGRDNLHGVEPEAERKGHGRMSFVRGDVTDRPAVRAAIAGHHAVVHLAAESHVDRSLLDPDRFEHTNATGTEIVCSEAAAAGVERLLHVSTDEVYGSIDAGASREADPLRPSSPYAASKASSDLIALAHHTSHGLPVVVTRSSNQFGPRQFPEKLIPHFVATLLEGGNVPLYGDGRHVRDWLHVDDGCAALDRVLRTGAAGEVYNVAGHQARTNRAVTDALLALLGLDASRIDHVTDRPGHDRRYAMATEKAEGLGIVPGRPFEAALEQTVRWYVDHPGWWQPRRSHVRNR